MRRIGHAGKGEERYPGCTHSGSVYSSVPGSHGEDRQRQRRSCEREHARSGRQDHETRQGDHRPQTDDLLLGLTTGSTQGHRCEQRERGQHRQRGQPVGIPDAQGLNRGQAPRRRDAPQDQVVDERRRDRRDRDDQGSQPALEEANRDRDQQERQPAPRAQPRRREASGGDWEQVAGRWVLRPARNLIEGALEPEEVDGHQSEG